MDFNLNRIRGIIEYQGKFLMVKHKGPKDTSTYWALPGGGREPGELITKCLEREIFEELGVKPVVGRLIFIQQFEYEPGVFSGPEFFFHITNGKDYLNLDLSNTSHGAKELAAAEFIDVTMEIVRPSFLITELPKLAAINFKSDTKYFFSN